MTRSGALGGTKLIDRTDFKQQTPDVFDDKSNFSDQGHDSRAFQKKNSSLAHRMTNC